MHYWAGERRTICSAQGRLLSAGPSARCRPVCSMQRRAAVGAPAAQYWAAVCSMQGRRVLSAGPASARRLLSAGPSAQCRADSSMQVWAGQCRAVCSVQGRLLNAGAVSSMQGPSAQCRAVCSMQSRQLNAKAVTSTQGWQLLNARAVSLQCRDAVSAQCKAVSSMQGPSAQCRGRLLDAGVVCSTHGASTQGRAVCPRQGCRRKVSSMKCRQLDAGSKARLLNARRVRTIAQCMAVSSTQWRLPKCRPSAARHCRLLHAGPPAPRKAVSSVQGPVSSMQGPSAQCKGRQLNARAASSMQGPSAGLSARLRPTLARPTLATPTLARICVFRVLAILAASSVCFVPRFSLFFPHSRLL